MIRNEFVKKLATFSRGFTLARNARSASDINIKKLEEESSTTEVELYDEEAIRQERGIEASRNKSRLRLADRKILKDENPYPEPKHWHHGTIRYLRRTYGRYGEASGIDPSICWPTKEELEDAKEYERVKYYYTIQQVVKENEEKRLLAEKAMWERQRSVEEKVKKLDQWKKELADKIGKKEREASAAKERKERLVEEVRRHFGYKIDPRDEKFKEMLAKKEKEQKKATKEARKKIKEDQLIEKLLRKKSAAAGEPQDAVEEKEK